MFLKVPTGIDVLWMDGWVVYLVFFRGVNKLSSYLSSKQGLDEWLWEFRSIVGYYSGIEMLDANGQLSRYF